MGLWGRRPQPAAEPSPSVALPTFLEIYRPRPDRMAYTHMALTAITASPLDIIMFWSKRPGARHRDAGWQALWHLQARGRDAVYRDPTVWLWGPFPIDAVAARLEIVASHDPLTALVAASELETLIGPLMGELHRLHVERGGDHSAEAYAKLRARAQQVSTMGKREAYEIALFSPVDSPPRP